MQRLLVDIGDIESDLGADVDVVAEADLGEIVVGDERFAPIEPVEVEATLTNTGAGIVARGRARLRAEATCSRCLEPCETVIDADLEGFYVRPGHEADLPDDQEYEFFEARQVDLTHAVVAALAVEAPFAPLCSEKCAGICPHCGTNLNLEDCGCSEEPDAEGPFAKLKDLLPGEG